MALADRINSLSRRLPTWPVYILVAAWVAWLFWLGLSGQLGPEPINTLERKYGLFALQLLVAGLAVTPLRTWTGVNLIRFRRAIGVSAFFVVLAHFSVWALLDVQRLGAIWADIVKRPYVTVGFLSFLLLIPLAMTSNTWSVRRLGPRWRQLHKLTYPALLLGGLHFWWLTKGWQWEPLLYLGGIVALLSLRIRLGARRRPTRARTV
ncbi:protein-methionine-sulfoxide reductase heme-binding subunit MsrQ [Wenxinia marina]|uniref:Protein-methionine-sulfoxide reductase heme-binding subunit MsrQ n=1 Tax=Wenxinia marina DSM 24838 TaxID=1123501 RepID=A0A0D0NT22_9RHOB|nr:protein-methionine-sulfoxide reductase heme-binding subunit MsrQ [Wenxinia marina]KIQ71350.1 putative membrane protein [Wenxinia marina DSM 24838]GGL81375.1 protein-methionine-sulfoxide reductase heme-binding subunit MsrQ [Wenxinia marina]